MHFTIYSGEFRLMCTRRKANKRERRNGGGQRVRARWKTSSIYVKSLTDSP